MCWSTLLLFQFCTLGQIFHTKSSLGYETVQHVIKLQENQSRQQLQEALNVNIDSTKINVFSISYKQSTHSLQNFIHSTERQISARLLVLALVLISRDWSRVVSVSKIVYILVSVLVSVSTIGSFPVLVLVSKQGLISQSLKSD